ncbi:hypothetical protein ACTFIU_008569 [Dictyostelium citrinum]
MAVNLNFVLVVLGQLVVDPMGQFMGTFANNKSVLLEDLECLESLTNIYLYSMNISKELLFYNFPNIEYISYSYGKYDCPMIDQPLPTTNTFTFSCKSLNNTIFKMSYLQNANYVSLAESYFYIENDITSFSNYRNKHFFSNAINIPDFSGIPRMEQVAFLLVEDFISSSLQYYSTINSNFISLASNHITLDPLILETNQYCSEFNLKIVLNKPTRFVDLSQTNYSYITINRPGNDFHIDGQFPILENSKLSIEYGWGSGLSVLPNFSQFGPIIYMYGSNFSAVLPEYTGKNQSIRILQCNITGTVSKSWCKTDINLAANKLTGEIPSCFTCYFSDPTVYAKFSLNNFSNYNQSLGCPTFAPQFKLIGSNSFRVTGTDIGFNPNYWSLNSNNIPVTNFTTILIGNEYIVNFNDTDLSGQDYFSISFEHPQPSQTITFPIAEKSPLPTGIEISSNQLLIKGSFFSSYIGYSNQSVEINYSTNCLINHTNFFNLTCEFDISSALSYPTIITIKNDNSTRKVIINPQQGELNQVTCPNNCDDFENKFCDLSNGICSIECNVNCGSFGSCNYSTGVCDCDSNHQGSDCSIPFKQCPVGSKNSLICSGFYCNNQTGICDCNSKFTGDDCSKPNPYISSIIPSNTNGGEASFFGWFGDSRSNLSILIGIQKCHPITYNTSNEIKCIAPPGNGVYDITLKQDDIEYILRDSYRYDEIIKSCPNNCTNSNQGICNTSNGECKCINSYYSFDCSLKRNNDSGGNPSIDPSTGGTNITDNQVNFQIYFKNLFEIDFSGNIVNQYSLQSNWTFNKTKDSQSNNIYKLSQTIQQSCEIVSSIEEISTPKQYSFAGSTFTLDAGSIKLTISISNYYYKSNLNTLQLQLISSVDNNQETDCNSKEVSTNEINTSSFKYIKISKDNRVLQGRFINKILSDGRPTFLSTDIKSEGNSIIATLNLPHFVNQSIIDPDFSVLLETDFKSKCDTKNDRKWLIPVAVVVPIVGLSCIGVIAYFIYRKQFVEKPLNIKLSSFGK